MAIYHFSAQIISRGKGQSVVAAAAYRSGERLTDERTGEEKFYRRDVEPDAMIFAPSHAPKWVYDRNRLWNEVEKIEKNKNSQLAREINIALPRELSNEQQKGLIKNYVQEQFVDKGMVADIAIHRDNPENPHAHILLTIRPFDENGEWGNKKRKEYELDRQGNKITDTNGKPKYKTISLTNWDKRETLEQWREAWAKHTNQVLEREGIQEHISHLSHEARGLEQLPTIHLGHIAHEMEKRGIETEKGNVNREREEYNRLVVDLQKYREEKEVLQQQIQQKERFTTPSERVDLQKASKVLKVAKPTLEHISNRYEQLSKWEHRVNNQEQYLSWKDRTIHEASEHYRWIRQFEIKIKESEQKIENLNWLNPLKLKENRNTKEQAEKDIQFAKDQIHYHKEKLQYAQQKLQFQTQNEFTQVKQQHEKERVELLGQYQKARNQIQFERNTLEKAQNALKNVFVREVASNYPESPEMAYMSFYDAQKLNELNQSQGFIIPIEKIEQNLVQNERETIKLHGEISKIVDTNTRLQRADEYLKHYEKYQAVVEKYENNPYLKGKMLISKSTRQEYQDAVSYRDRYQNLINEQGIKDRKDFIVKKSIQQQLVSKIPIYQAKIQTLQGQTNVIKGIMKGLEIAHQKAYEQQRQQEQKPKQRAHSRNRSEEWER